MNIIQDIQNVLQNNQILTTVAGGSVIVWIITNIKMLFWTFVRIITELISFTVVNYYEDKRSERYSMYTQQTVFNTMLNGGTVLWERTKNLDLAGNNVNHDDYIQHQLALRANCVDVHDLPYGTSWRIILGSLCMVTRTINNNTQKIVVSTSIRVFFTRKTKFMRKLKERLCTLTDEFVQKTRMQNITPIETMDTISWKYNRSLDSIFTVNDEHIKLYEDIQRFVDNREVYESMNYPYKYSALIYGDPGCGKSSTILAIASKMHRQICYINLLNISSGRLVEMLNSRCDEHIYVFEDIDALSTSSTSTREDCNDDESSMSVPVRGDSDFGPRMTSSISLADLLNITDGLLSSDGAICIFTTNHIERLDPAFIRSGRMNTVVKFTYMDKKTAGRMISTYLKTDVDNLKDDIKPAELQEEILQIKLGKSSIEKLKEKFCHNSQDTSNHDVDTTSHF